MRQWDVYSLYDIALSLYLTVVTEIIAKQYKPLSTYKSFTNHAHWVIGEPGWLEIADDVSEWLISTTTSSNNLTDS